MARYPRNPGLTISPKHLIEMFGIFVLVGGTLLVIGIIAVSGVRERQSSNENQDATPVANISADPSEQLAKRFLDDEDFGAAVATYNSILIDQPSNAAALVGRGIAYGHERKYSLAIDDLEAAARLASWSEAIQLDLGWLYSQIHEHKKAIRHYERAVELNPDSVLANANLGRCYFEQGDFQMAANSLSEALRTTPRDRELRINRAVTLGKLGHHLLAAEDMKVAASSLQDSRSSAMLASYLLSAGEAAKSLQALQQPLNQDPSSTVLQCLATTAMNQMATDQGHTDPFWHQRVDLTIREFALTKEEIVSARQYCEDARSEFLCEGHCSPRFVEMEQARLLPSEIPSDEADKQYANAVVLADKGDVYSGLAFVNAALRIDPQHRQAVRLRATLFLLSGQLSPAEEAFKELTVASFDDAELWTQLAMVYSRQGKFESSLGAFDQAVRIHSNNPIVFLNRAMLRYTVGGDDPSVVEDCRRAQRLGFASAPLFDLEAKALSRLGDFQAAHKAHSRAIQEEPQVSQWLVSHCETCLLEGKAALGHKYIQEALVLDPENTSAEFLNATCLFRLGRPEQALTVMASIRESDPDNPEWAIMHARVLHQLKRYDGAIEASKIAVSRESESDDQAFLAECYFKSDLPNEAWEWIQSAMNRDALSESVDADPKKLLLASRIQEVRGETKSSYNYLAQSIGEAPATHAQAMKLCVAAQACNQWSDSLRWLEFIESAKQSDEFWYHSGFAFEKLNEPMNALKCYSESLLKNADYPEPRLGRARVLITLKQYGDALSEINRLAVNEQFKTELQQLRSQCLLLGSYGR